MATSSSTSLLPWHHPLLHTNTNSTSLHRKFKLRNPSFLSPPLTGRSGGGGLVVAFQRGDFESFKKRVASGEAWRDAWRSANDGFEQFVFEATKAAERLDRRYSLSRRLSSAAESASIRVRELDRQYEVSQKWRTFSLDFSRNWPGYRKQLNDSLDTPLGMSFKIIFFTWFALSGWLFKCLIFATWVLPIAVPLLISTAANKLVVKGNCPACKREFIGSKMNTIRCTSCGNIVWQPQGDFFSKDGNKGGGASWSKSEPEVIDVDFEVK